MDGLKNIFHIQKINDDFWYDREKFANDREYRLQVVRDFVLGIYDQTAKLMNAFDWKKHDLNAIEDKDNAIEQLIDIDKYVKGVLLFMGVGAEEYEEKFHLKSNVLMERWTAQAEKMTNETQVVVFDIDGVIANYDETYRNFLEDNCGLARKSPEEHRYSYSYHKQYGISKTEEEHFHADFIKMGGFRNIKPYPGVKETIESIRKLGVKVILLTARPSWIYKRLITDTYWWLKEHEFNYDMLLWDKDKAETLVNHVFPANVLYFIEDRDKHAIEISHLGVDVLLFDRSYNRNIADSENIKRVYKNNDITSNVLIKVGKIQK